MSINKLKMDRCSDGSLIERIDTMKYLGIVIDDKLQFKHCDYILKKIGKKTSFLRMGNFVSTCARRIVYIITASHFEDCAMLMVNMGEAQHVIESAKQGHESYTTL